MNNSDSVKTWLTKRLNLAIAESGLRIDAISKKSGMPNSTLNAKRRGYSSITFDDIFLLAPVLGFSPSFFIPPQMSQDSVKETR